jgi:hypothetical protein
MYVAIGVAIAPGRADAGPFAGGTLTDRAGLHVVRLGLGWETGRWGARVSLDPLVFTDGQHTLDAVGELEVGRGIALHAGWRDTTIGVAGGTRHFQAVLVGASAPLVTASWIVLRGGLELSQLVVAHGADTETRWFDSGPMDTFPLGLFVEGRHAF